MPELRKIEICTGWKKLKLSLKNKNLRKNTRNAKEDKEIHRLHQVATQIAVRASPIAMIVARTWMSRPQMNPRRNQAAERRINCR